MKYGTGNKERIARFCILLLAALSWIAIATAQEPPTAEETQLWNNIRDRLVANQAQWPYNVNDVLSSFPPNVPIIIPLFNCTNSTAGVTKVDITVRTRLVHWNTTKYSNCTGKAGCYIWRGPQPIPIDANHVKHVDAENELMLNLSALVPFEDTDAGKSLNEGVLYHELLHGQLLIDAAKNSDKWKNDTCNCSFNLNITGIGNDDTANTSHSQITVLEGDYVDRTAPGTVIRKQHQFNVAGPKFNVNVNLAEDLETKENYIFNIYPMDDNVWVDSIDSPSQGTFTAQGRISGGQGRIRLIVDPPNLTIIDDITISYLSSTTITSVEGSSHSTIGLIVLVACLTLIGILRFKNKI
ncbi:MAG: hypothetical protein O8C64_13750 [Candidatus Methanoperedens sp.]|nr:hypothetical protein [Candidatus Methanoperedens sp.]MCZ7404967.1 hypothetical protein [Candidatus Methanoperedens sp.]